MQDLKQFLSAIEQIAEEKGIPKEKVIEVIEMALAAAYKKDYGKKGQIIKIKLDPETGDFEVFQIKLVVDKSMLKEEEEIQTDPAPETSFRYGASTDKDRQTRTDNGKDEQTRTDTDKNGQTQTGTTTEKEGLSSDLPADLSAEARGAKAEALAKADLSAEVPMAIGTEAEALAEEEKKIRFNPEKHIMVEEAKKIQKGIKPGEELWTQLEVHKDYGRIAAQTAKQVIIQRIREAERDAIYEEYKSKEGEIVSGIVQRLEGFNVFVDVGKFIGVLYPQEQIPNERYRIGQRLRVYISKVEQDAKGPNIILSRSHPKMISKLFEMEVPEISMGSVVIKSLAREAGSRSKIAVASTAEGVDPVGSCVGQKGTRVQTVINEIGGEKIDIIEWNEKIDRFIANSLSPAKISSVRLDTTRGRALVEVPEDQLSLAIGKEGQNVRLAAKLTGWKIDIVTAKTAAEAAGGEKGKEKSDEEKPKKKEKKKKEKTDEEKPKKKIAKKTKEKKEE